MSEVKTFIEHVSGKSITTNGDIGAARQALSECMNVIGRAIAEARRAENESCALLHENVPIEEDSDMGAIIRYRDLIRQRRGGGE